MAPRIRKPILPPLDAAELLPELYQGSLPPRGGTVAGWGFDAVVLCAVEYQPPATEYPGLMVIRARLDDSRAPVTNEEWRQALRAASQVADLVSRGGRVLVTCFMGHNRSGLVSALAIHMLTGLPGKVVVEEIRRRRPGALRNQQFVAALEQLPGERRRAQPTQAEDSW